MLTCFVLNIALVGAGASAHLKKYSAVLFNEVVSGAADGSVAAVADESVADDAESFAETVADESDADETFGILVSAGGLNRLLLRR